MQKNLKMDEWEQGCYQTNDSVYQKMYILFSSFANTNIQYMLVFEHEIQKF